MEAINANQGTVSRGEWGFTDSIHDFNAVVAWRDAAIADGWEHRPTYGTHESEDRACKLTKDRFVVQVLTRTHEKAKRRYEAQVSAWGPDGLAIRVPDIYDWHAIQSAVMRCNYCGACPVETSRVAFAGRACGTCGPQERAKLPRNWAD